MGRPILAWIKRLCDHVIGLLGAENGTPSQLQVSATRRDFREACKLLGIDPIDAGEAIHAAKADRRLSGADECIFDLENGDIIF